MNKIFKGLILPLLFLTLSCQSQQKKTELKDDKEKLSYALGINVGASLQHLQSDIDLATLFQGIEDTLSGGKILMTQKEVMQAMQQAKKRTQEKQTTAKQELAQKNIVEGEAFLEKNKDKEGVQTTESGLQYKILIKGDGPKPKATDRVKVHYRGTSIDGTEFDSSYKRKQPATFAVNGVIKGWTEALQLMHVGSKYELFIPSNLAYGLRGSGSNIGPNSMLIFEVELLAIE